MYFRRYGVAISLAAVVFMASTPEAAAAECQPPDGTPRFEVNVDVDIGETIINNNLSKARLGRRSNSHGRQRQILGTMQGKVDLRWFINYKIEDFRDVHCFWVASATVELTYHQLDVNIASEYGQYSCQYQAILEHENQHVRVALEILSPYEQKIRAALTTLSIPTPDLPSVAQSPEQARAEVQEVFRRILLPVRDEMNRLVRTRQAKVDTRENYRRTFQRCPRW